MLFWAEVTFGMVVISMLLSLIITPAVHFYLSKKPEKEESPACPSAPRVGLIDQGKFRIRQCPRDL